MIETANAKETRMKLRRAFGRGVNQFAALIGLVVVLQCGPAMAQLSHKLDSKAPVQAQPPLPSPSVYPLQLVIDDNTQEGAFGLTSGLNARQFLWFNRFTNSSGTPTRLEQVWVLFPSGANINAGAAVQIVVYQDTDGNPANGAQLILAFDTTIQFADNTTFSIYQLPSAVQLNPGFDVLIGVIPRFIVSGVTTPTNPAALDTSTSSGRSWVAVWNGDPPALPALPPDALITQVDNLQQGGGNWMIRAFGVQLAAASVPSTDAWSMWLIGALLAFAGVLATRRR